MTYKIMIFPEGTPVAEQGEHWSMDAVEYDETIVEDGESILVSHHDLPNNRDIGDFSVRVLSEEDANIKMELILANKFSNFKGQTWAAALGVVE